MRVLHTLSQRPLRTGSGMTLDAITRQAARAQFEQAAIVGVPEGAHTTAVLAQDLEGLSPDAIWPLVFERPPLDFHVPGMSDVMPYESTRFADMRPDQLQRYRDSWRDHLLQIKTRFRPDLIHSHHVWLLSALLKDVFEDTPIVTHCHATGLRQMELCPHLAPEVSSGCGRNEAFVTLHSEHAQQLKRALGIAQDQIHVVGAGYRQSVFRFAPHPNPRRLVYAGKLSKAKGLAELLDAIEPLSDVELCIAGAGSGPEAQALKQRIERAPNARWLGRLPQDELVALFQSGAVFVLPSFYEGLPLVLIEALACGCRLVCTSLPGVVQQIQPAVGELLELVPLPKMRGVDTPEPAAIPGFVASLRTAILRALQAPALSSAPQALERFTWAAVFERVRAVWEAQLAG